VTNEATNGGEEPTIRISADDHGAENPNEHTVAGAPAGLRRERQARRGQTAIGGAGVTVDQNAWPSAGTSRDQTRSRAPIGKKLLPDDCL